MNEYLKGLLKKTFPLNAWDEAKKIKLFRHSPYHDPKYFKGIETDAGVNFFVLMIEKLGGETQWSCEGHPDGFYIVFKGEYDLARALASAYGGFDIIVMDELNKFGIYLRDTNLSNKNIKKADREKLKQYSLRHAAMMWEESFGSLDLENVR